MPTLFFSYSHADERLRDQLETHLSAIKRQGLIDTWHDRRILAGQEFAGEIDENLDKADLILLLVSSDFLASNYCYDREMQRAMQRHEQREATVIPVILRPCDWQDTPFGKNQATPKDARPIVLWPNADEAFLDVVKAIKNTLKAAGAKVRFAAPQAARPIPSAAAARSSNLRIKKQFTQYDKDQFLHEAFDYIAKYFEHSLKELVERNAGAGLTQTFRRIDADRFTCAAYQNGAKVCQCAIYLGGMFSSIAYSTSDTSNAQSLNESLSVEADDQSLFLKTLGMMSHGGPTEKLSLEGAAEFLWSHFIVPLQF